jgi:hypothetical protein
LQLFVACFLLISLSKVAVPLQAQNSDEQTVSLSRTQPSTGSSKEQTTQLEVAPRGAEGEARVSGTVLDPAEQQFQAHKSL